MSRRHSRRRPTAALRPHALFEPLELRRLLTGSDLFSAAPTLTGLPLSTTGSNAAATAEPSEPAHATYPATHSVWWNWTPTTTGPVTIDTFGSNFDTLLAVYTGPSLNALTEIASNDQSNGTDQSRVTFTATAGTTYHVAVDGWSNQTGNISLNFTGPPNDPFAFASPLNTDSASGSNVNATAEPAEPAHAPGQPAIRSVWWRWTSPVTGNVSFDTFGSSFDTVLAVYSGDSLPSLTQLASNDDVAPGTPQSLLTFPAVANVVYYIAVDGRSGATGDIQLHLTGLPTPANDDFADATLLTGPTATATGTNVGATPEPGEPAHATYPANHSVWYQWTAPADGITTINTFGSDFDTLLAVYTGNAVGALTEIASNDQAGGSNQSRVSFFATAGTTYRIAVDGWNNAIGTVTLSLGVPDNDDFAFATPLDSFATSGTNVGASLEPDEPTHAGQTGGHSVWWRWTAPVTGDISLDTLGSSFDTLLAVYVGSDVSSLTEVASNDDAGAGTTQSSLTFSALAGATYYIAVDGYGGATGSIELALAGFSPPANDDFDNAAPLTGATVNLTATNVGATNEPGELSHASSASAHSVWWTWTAPSSGPFIIHTSGSNFDTVLAIYTGNSLDALSLVASDDDAGLGYGSLVDFTAVAGTTYRIAVAGYDAGEVGDISLSIAPYFDITATPGPDTIRVTTGPTPDTALVFINNNTATPNHTIPLSSVGRLRILSGQGDDTLILDFAAGNPLPGGGIAYDGGTGADAVQLLSTSGSLEVYNNRIDYNEYGLHLIDVESRSAQANGLTFAYVYSGTIRLASNSPFSTDPANLDLYAQGGTVFLDGPTNLRGLELSDDALVVVAPGGNNVMRTREFDIFGSATLDLNDNPVIIDHDPVPLGDIVPDLRTGYNSGAWNGIGIRSSTAAANAGRAIGYIDNSVLGLSSFAGIPIDATTRLLQYTYAGDANFDGRITRDDYALADRGLLLSGTAWWQGDFNYDGAVTPADLQLLRPTPPTPAPVAPTPTATTTSLPTPTPAPILTAPLSTTLPSDPTPTSPKPTPAKPNPTKSKPKAKTPTKKPAPKPHKKPKPAPTLTKPRAPRPTIHTLFSTMLIKPNHR